MQSYSSVVFLDIDGVLQPRTQKRFNYQDDIADLCVELESRCGGRYPYTEWHGTREIDDMDIGAVHKAQYDIPNDKYLEWRTCEIREYLDRHPEIVSYAAVDDMDLSIGLDGHAVCTSSFLSAADLERLLAVLSMRDGPFPLPEACRTQTVREFQRDVIPLEESEWMRMKPIRSRWA